MGPESNLARSEPSYSRLAALADRYQSGRAILAIFFVSKHSGRSARNVSRFKVDEFVGDASNLLIMKRRQLILPGNQSHPVR